MGSLFRILSKELFSLGTLFFVIVPFIMSMKDDYSARQHLTQVKDQTQYAVQSTYEGAKNNFSFGFTDLSIGKGGPYGSGKPIHMPPS